jgi:hypothetical protein
MIPVILEPCMKNAVNWEGIMGLTLGTMLYVDMTSDDALILEEKCDELFHRIQTLSHDKNSLSSVTKSPAPPTVDIKEEAPPRQDPPTVVSETKDETAAVSPGTASNIAKEIVDTKRLWMQAPLRKVALDETPLSPAPPTVNIKEEAPSRQDPPTVVSETKDETAADSSILPHGWIQLVDPVSQKPYFANQITGLTQWEPPSAGSTTSDASAGRNVPALQ